MHLREFGFPRIKEKEEELDKKLLRFINLKKKLFKWKKTNFVTDLPKHAPIVRYLVAKSKMPDQPT